MPLYHGAEFQSCWAPIRGSLLFTHSSRWTIRRLCVFFRLGAFPSKSPLAGFAWGFLFPETNSKHTGWSKRGKEWKQDWNCSHTCQGKITRGFKASVCVCTWAYCSTVELSVRRFVHHWCASRPILGWFWVARAFNNPSEIILRLDLWSITLMTYPNSSQNIPLFHYCHVQYAPDYCDFPY